MYKVTLWDRCIVACCSGTISFYVDDIDRFQKEWFELESNEDQKKRFLESKAGKVVTDYYSDSQELNIVQEDPNARVYFERDFVLEDRWYELHNAYRWPAMVYIKRLKIHAVYVKYEDTYKKLMTYSIEGIASEGMIEDCAYARTRCWGNHVLKIKRGHPDVYSAKEFAAFEKDCIESIVYHEVGRYKTYATLKRHYESARLTDQDIDFLLRDILGEAG
jgi:hypothetical protein